MAHFPVQDFRSCQQLKVFASKPKTSLIEKTLRIAAALFLAIPALLFDLGMQLARTIQNKLTGQSMPKKIELQTRKDPDASPPSYEIDQPPYVPTIAPPPYSEYPAIFPSEPSFAPSAPSISLLSPAERAKRFPNP
jgi:hypothetical protein